MAGDTPRVSVIIPARNATRHLRACLAEVLPAARERRWDVLVVDDASTDGTADLAESLGARTLRLRRNVGVARARNLGARLAPGDLLVFVDADIVAPPATLDALVDRLRRDPSVHATGGYPEADDLSRRWGARLVGLRAAWGFAAVARAGRDLLRFPSIQSECGAFRREVFEELGGFPEHFTGVGMEEYALAHAMERRGYVNVLLATAPYRHYFKPVWRRAKELARRTSRWVPLVLRRRRFESPGAVGTPRESLSCLMSALWPAALAAAAAWGPVPAVLAAGLVLLQLALEARFLAFARRHDGWPMALLAWPALQVLHWGIGVGFLAGLARVPFRRADGLPPRWLYLPAGWRARVAADWRRSAAPAVVMNGPEAAATPAPAAGGDGASPPGLHGRLGRRSPHILGLSTTIDAGAAVVADGRILAAVNEERLTRRKFQCGLPLNSLQLVLDLAGVRPGDIDYVTLADQSYSLYTDPDAESFERPNLSKRLALLLSELGLLRWALASRPGLAAYRVLFGLLLERTLIPLRRRLRDLGVTAPIIPCDHHTCHAAAAAMTSGWPDCLALTMDLSGDGLSSMVTLWREGRLQIVKEVSAYHSFGVFYTYASMFLGHKPGREGKTTGLAAYGNPYATLPIYRRYARYNPRTEQVENRAGGVAGDWGALTARLRAFTREDIAAGIQRHFEREIARSARAYVRRWGVGRLALAGGVFANVRVNQALRELPGVENIFVFPHMSDGGGAAGSALWWWNVLTGDRPAAIEHVYLGPAFTNEDCAAALRAATGLRWRRVADVDQELARRLAQGQIVARFRGPMEYGPRALGNRSILYRPTDASVNDWLNKRLVRTEYMPFAPTVLEEYAGEYFEGWRPSDRAAWFMTATYRATPLCRRNAPAVVHVDGTARPQVLRREHNPAYHRLIDLFRQATGLPLVLNTSFNMHEEPIVCTPGDAVRAFTLARLDAMGLEDYLVEIDDGGVRHAEGGAPAPERVGSPADAASTGEGTGR